MHIYAKENTDWQLSLSISSSSIIRSRYFGSTLDLTDDYLAIGDYEHGRNKEGAVTVYKNTDGVWSQQARLTGGAVTNSSHFGRSVAVSKDYLLIGAPQENHPSQKNSKKCGAVYVYKRSFDQWIPQTKLTSSDINRNDNFGQSVSIFDDHLIIGASGDDIRRGSAYIFKLTGGLWSQTEKLSLSNANNNDYLGSTVALSDSHILIGAYNKNTGLNNTGSAYIYEINKDTSPTAADISLVALAIQLNNNVGSTAEEEADTDGDGLSDIDEIVILNTDPNNPDSDNDGLDDREETMIYQSDPLSSDSDSDGLSDLSEVITYNSSPISSDSDGDGYSDSVEALSLNTEPSLVDSDFDGLSDQEEITVTTTNPSLADTDGDGLTDNQELNLYQTNVFNADSDQDGFSDGNEVNYYQTNPLDKANKPDSNTTSTSYTPAAGESGTMAFEDEWPITGDYDFNDAVVNYNVEEYKQNGLVKRITFKVLPVARGAVYDNSLRLVINTPISNIAEASTKSRGVTSDLAPVADGNKTQFMLIDDLKSALPPPPGLMLSNTLTGSQKINGHQFVVTITFNYPIDPAILGAPPYNTFIARQLDNGELIEVHFPGFPPTRHASRRQLGSIQDDSDSTQDRFYQTKDNLPWAMNMPSNWHHPKERVDLANGYPDILNWAKSKGKKNKDWYKSKRKSLFVFDNVSDL
ncbi:LruC domain-containing protein [Vibrio pectenicida]|uniref:LruC domain-containing protein n=1 Tax=Vibrio pectenicida TaxID=62763 RepID=UPI003B9B3552